MAPFCRNRPEGFGLHSSLHPSLPTTCFLDVIIVPLPTWILLVLLLALVPRRVKVSHQRRASEALKPTRPIDPEPSLPWDSSKVPRSSLLTRVLGAVYYFLAIAILAMVSLEIARLTAAELGIGLLPFTYAGVLAALANRMTWRRRSARLVNGLFWALLAVAMALKVAAEADEGTNSRRKGVGVQGRYPMSDEILDVSVMIGLEAAMAVLEFVGWHGLGVMGKTENGSDPEGRASEDTRPFSRWSGFGKGQGL